jgi:hypothetical protein
VERARLNLGAPEEMQRQIDPTFFLAALGLRVFAYS